MKNPDGSFTIYGGHPCQYTPKAVFNSWGVVYTVPTAYDQEHFIWEHKGGFNDKIIGTIIYNGKASNISVRIPLLGYKESSVNVDGINFFLRTGPRKCSIRTDQTDVNVGSFQFAFTTI